MTRANISGVLETMDVSAEVGPILKMLGDEMQKRWMAENGVYLNADERKEHSGMIASVDTSDIEVRIGTTSFSVQQVDENKPIVGIPVGMSDKKNTATIPRDWLLGYMLDYIIHAFEGDDSPMKELVSNINEWIDFASITDEETGRLKIDSNLLPQPDHTVPVVEAISSLKRQFVTESAGSPRVNLVLVAKEIVTSSSTLKDIEPSTPVKPKLSKPVLSEPAPNFENKPSPIMESRWEDDEGFDDTPDFDVDKGLQLISTTVCANSGLPATFVVNDLPIGPRAFATEKDYCEFAGIDFKYEGFYGYTEAQILEDGLHDAKNIEEATKIVESTLELVKNMDEVEDDADGQTDTTDGPVELGITGAPLDVEIVILRAINNSGETDGATWGLIKKTAKADGSCDDLTPHRRVLDKLVKAGAVNKEGTRRSTRYFLTGSGLEAMVGMPLPGVIQNDLESTSMTPSGDSPVAVAKENIKPAWKRTFDGITFGDFFDGKGIQRYNPEHALADNNGWVVVTNNPPSYLNEQPTKEQPWRNNGLYVTYYSGGKQTAKLTEKQTQLWNKHTGFVPYETSYHDDLTDEPVAPLRGIDFPSDEGVKPRETIEGLSDVLSRGMFPGGTVDHCGPKRKVIE
jgi:hypothetical protein